MAADGVGLLDHLGIERAHVVGVSMGGMIAQTIAARRPERVLSLTSIMSSTGSRWRGQPALRTYRQFLRPVVRRPRGLHRPDRRAVRHHRLARLRARRRGPARAARRDVRPRPRPRLGHAASSRAIVASGDRTAELRHITAPTLVIHGTADKLVAPSGGRATARAIPGARLLMIEGMGHDLPRGAWPQLIDAIVENTRRAGAPAGGREAA